MTTENKNGRPKKWLGETTHIRVPVEYADALRDIAFEWQLNKIDAVNECLSTSVNKTSLPLK
jgi:hypothetical protein